MWDIRKIAATAVIATMALGGIPAAFGKAHDQGKADGIFCVPGLQCPDANNARDQIDFLTAAGALDGNGVSALQNKGQRGEASNDGAKKGGINCFPTGSSFPCPAAQ